jgi:hypothetical protein
MDDKTFESRLQSLKHAYDEMPKFSNSERIVEAVKQSEKSKKRKFHTYFPLVVSFIGAVLVGGLLTLQFMNQIQQGNEPEKPTPQENITNPVESPPARKEIEEKVQQLRDVYDQQVKELENELQIKNAERYAFVAEAKNTIDVFASFPFKNDGELQKKFVNTQEFIERRVATPKDEIEILTIKGKDQPSMVTDQDLLGFINKQKELQELYSHHLERFTQAIYDEANQAGFDETIIKLNQQAPFSASAELNEFVQTVLENGYHFTTSEGGFYIEIDYERLKKQLEMVISDVMAKYLEIEAHADISEDASLTVTWDELADRIVELERFILKNPTFKENTVLYDRYKNFMRFYLKGMDNTDIADYSHPGQLAPEVKNSYERFLKEYNNTEAYAIVKEYYNKLKFNHYRLTEEIRSYDIKFPELYEPNAGASHIKESLFPLTEDLQSIYNQYKEKKDDSLLIGLRPFDVMRIYMYADSQRDIDTMYALYYKDDDAIVPPREQVLMDMKRSPVTNYAELNASLRYADERLNDENNAVIFLYLSNSEPPKNFFLKKTENGIWKPVYLPMQ